jgi:hypothetical protein
MSRGLFRLVGVRSVGWVVRDACVTLHVYKTYFIHVHLLVLLHKFKYTQVLTKLHEAHPKRPVTMNTRLTSQHGYVDHKAEMLNTLQLLS